MGKQPRKLRMGRNFDKMYGNSVRGKHISSPLYIKRTNAQRIADMRSFIISGSSDPPQLDWSLQNSSSINKGLILDKSGSTRMGDYLIGSVKDFTFACWAKPTDPAPVSQSLFCIAKSGSQGPYMGWFGLVSSSNHTVKARFAVISGSGATNPLLEKRTLASTHAAALGAWHFFAFSYDSGSNTKLMIASDTNKFASLVGRGPLSASLKWERTSLFVKRSGSAATVASGSSFHGRVNQAAIWTTAMTSSGFTQLYNSSSAANNVWCGQGSNGPKYAYNFGFRDSTTYAPSYGNTSITASFVGGAASYVADGP